MDRSCHLRPGHRLAAQRVDPVTRPRACRPRFRRLSTKLRQRADPPSRRQAFEMNAAFVGPEARVVLVYLPRPSQTRGAILRARNGTH